MQISALDRIHQAHKARRHRFLMAARCHAGKSLPNHRDIVQIPNSPKVVYMKAMHDCPKLNEEAKIYLEKAAKKKEIIAKKALRLESGPLQHHTISNIKKRVARFWGVSVADLESKTRRRDFMEPRHIAMWLCVKYSRKSTSMIGRAFGGRDHTTVISARKKIDARKRLGLQAGDKEKSPVVLVAPVIVGSMEFPTKKAAVHYFLGKNMSAMEIASLIGSTENSVRSIISRNKKDPKFSGVEVDL